MLRGRRREGRWVVDATRKAGRLLCWDVVVVWHVDRCTYVGLTSQRDNHVLCGVVPQSSVQYLDRIFARLREAKSTTHRASLTLLSIFATPSLTAGQ